MSKVALGFEVAEIPAETFAFVVRRVEAGQVGEFIRGAIARVGDFADERGGAQGPPMSICSAPDEYGSLIVEAGWPVAPGTAPVAPVEIRTLPATRAAVHRHTGPYEELDSAFYGELFSAVHDEGLLPTSGPRERYLGEGVAEIVWPIA